MNLRKLLASAFAARHPLEAAAALETRPAKEIARVIGGLVPDTAAGVLRHLSPGLSAHAVEQLDKDTAAGIVAELETDDALLLLRRMTPMRQDAILQAMPEERAKALSTIIRFPEGTAGALMDPRVVALPTDMAADKALQAVRREAEHAHYQLYVVDREGKLAGVLDLQELLLAHPKDRLETIMQPVHHKLSPSADRYAITRHIGWRDVHSLPVVNGDGRLLGAVHYRILRALEDELHEIGTASGESAARALGDLFWTGVGGVIETLTAVVAPRQRGPASRPTAPPGGEQTSNNRDDGLERHIDGEE